MDKVILDEMQILQLKNFIRQKGIMEQDVVHELLDHFACKTEELMNENYKLPFHNAMLAAFYSFGHNGFKLISEQYEKKMKRLVWAEFKKSIPSVIQSRLIIISFVWCCFLSMVAAYREMFFEENFFTDSIVFLTFGTMLLFYMIRIKTAFIAKESLADYACNKNAFMWQKKITKMQNIDLLFFPLFISNFYFKFGPEICLVAMMVLGFLSLTNSLVKTETMKRMNFKFAKAF